MVPAPAVEEVLLGKNGISHFLSRGDFVIDGGNSFYLDSRRRQKKLSLKGIHFVDVGVSGGPKGAREGACLMVGGKKKDFERLKALFNDLSAKGGAQFFPGAGAGHFVKMVHNGIEYAMMEAYGEGFEILKASPYSEYLSLQRVARLWNRGSVIRSWLLELLESAFGKDPELESIQGYVEDSGEARWTVHEAVDLGVSAVGIAHALFKRFQSRQEDVFSDKVLAALRHEFGGHAITQKVSKSGKREQERVE